MKLNLIAITILIITSCTNKEIETKVYKNTENKEIVTSTNFEQKVIAKDINKEELKSMISTKSIKLIDVRTPEEYKNGTIGEASNINFLSGQFLENIGKLDKNKPVIIFCQAGGRSSKAMQLMKDNGFKEVYNFVGGYGGWLQ